MQASFFLNRLGLDQAADERAVKRAYARELKQIAGLASSPAANASSNGWRSSLGNTLTWVPDKTAQPAPATE